MPKVEIIPQSIKVLPRNRQAFRVRSSPPGPQWYAITNGVINENYSLSHASAPFGAGGHILESGVGNIQWTIDNNCKPSSTGNFRYSIYFLGQLPNPAYHVNIKASTIDIRDQNNVQIGLLTFTVAPGDIFQLEISANARLYINGNLVHTYYFPTTTAYPIGYDAAITTPVVGSLPTIPAPRLSGRWVQKNIGFCLAPEHGLLTIADSNVTEYYGAEIPGVYHVFWATDYGANIWVEDAVPTGATSTGAEDGWNFISSNPTPFSGTLAHDSPNAAGHHHHEFTGASTPLSIPVGSQLFTWVFLDPTNPPQEIMLAWRTGSDFEHRAYWGANLLAFGTDGADSRRFMGSLPPTGQWCLLYVPAYLVGLGGLTINGMSYHCFDGRATWDASGVIAIGGHDPLLLQVTSSAIIVPPLEILGDSQLTLRPGQKIRIPTNYDDSETPLVSLSILGGPGSISQGEFTAASAPGRTVVRATATAGNQIADVAITVPAVITNANNYTAAAPSENIDFDTNIPAMPSFVSAGAMAEGTGNVTPGLPPGLAEKDIMLLFVETANEAVTAPTGWVAVADSPQGTGTAAGTAATRLTVFWKRAGITETAPTITDPGEHAVAQILAFRGCVNTGNPWDVTSGDVASSASTSVSIPGDTTTVVNCLVVLAVSNATDTATPQASGYTNASLANLTERTDINSTQGNGGGFAVITGEKATIGAYSATTATLATSSVQGRISIALKPALITWSATIGSINSSSGVWTAPSLDGQTAQITVTNGNFSATIEIPVLKKFPYIPSGPVRFDRKRTVLISTAEDRSRSSRIKEKDAIPFEAYELTFDNRDLPELAGAHAFWDEHYPGKLFIFEEGYQELRFVGYFDSDIRVEIAGDCSINYSFRFIEG
jgi:hypothetical protein